MADDRVLQLDRGDPLATRLDDVLRPVGQRDVVQGVDPADVAGTQPAVVELLRVVVAVVAPGDPGPADLELADRLPVRGQFDAVVVDDAKIHARDRPALGDPEAHHLLLVEAGRRPGDRRQRRGLCHPPGMQDPDAELLVEGLHQRARHRRSAAQHQTQRGQVGSGVVPQVVQDVVPDGGNGSRHGRAFLIDGPDRRLGLQEGPGQQQIGTTHQSGVRQAPGVGVKHRHDGENRVVSVDTETLRGAGSLRM